MQRSAFHIDAGGRKLFALFSEPDTAAHGIIVHVPAFAEEMNKSRQMVGLACQAFVADGWAVLQFDFSGCGDSSGLFEEANWEAWREDLDAVLDWCHRKAQGHGRVVLWGLRCGALHAGDWMKTRNVGYPMLLWHPVYNGKLHLTQFLRLRAANSMLSDADARNVMAELRTRLDGGEEVSVAGYRLSPMLAKGMNQASFGLSSPFSCKVAVFEVGAVGETGDISPATASAAEKWRAQGADVRMEVIPGQAFWNTQYLRRVPELIEASRRSLAWMTE